MSNSDSSNDGDMDVGGADNLSTSNSNDEDNNNASTLENYTQSEIEEKNTIIDSFLRVYEQYKSYQELLSKLEEPVDSDKRDYYLRFAHHLLQCEEKGGEGMKLRNCLCIQTKNIRWKACLLNMRNQRKRNIQKIM